MQSSDTGGDYTTRQRSQTTTPFTYPDEKCPEVDRPSDSDLVPQHNQLINHLHTSLQMLMKYIPANHNVQFQPVDLPSCETMYRTGTALIDAEQKADPG